MTKGQGEIELIIFSNEISDNLLLPHDQRSRRRLNPLQSCSAYNITHPKGSTEEIVFAQAGGRFMQSSFSKPTLSFMYLPKNSEKNQAILLEVKYTLKH